MTAVSPSADPADQLEDVAAVLEFLADATPALAAPGAGGLTDRSAHGLHLILRAVAETINRARSML